MSFVTLMSYKYKSVYGAAAEVAGMILAQMEETGHVCIIKLPFQTTFHCIAFLQFSMTNFLEAVVEQLMRLAAERNEQNFLVCLHKIQLAYSKITDRYSSI